MSISVASYNHVTWSGQPGGTTINLTGCTCAAGDVIYVLSSVAPSLSGETFSSIATLTGGTLYRCVAASSHSNSTITLISGSFVPGNAIFVAWTGIDNTQNTIGSINSTGGSATASASVTTAKANSLVLLFAWCPNTFTSAGAGYTLDENLAGSGSTSYSEEHGNVVTSVSGTSVTPTVTLASSSSWSAIAVSLAPSVGTSPLARRPIVASADYRSFWYDA